MLRGAFLQRVASKLTSAASWHSDISKADISHLCPCQMADERVKCEAPAQRENDIDGDESGQKIPSGNGEAAAENQNMSKRQRKKLLKQQKWEEERELRK